MFTRDAKKGTGMLLCIENRRLFLDDCIGFIILVRYVLISNPTENVIN